MSIKLAIDPGHGMSNRTDDRYDPGATAGGITEADIVLQWALTLRWVANQVQLPVFLTRDDDRDEAPVGQRDNQATAAGCTHFLSLHCNAAAGATTRGSETFYRGANERPFAAQMQSAVMAAMKSRDRGVKTEDQSQHARLAVLDFPGPAALVEIGFISNRQDRTLMLLRDVRLAFAHEVVRALGFPAR